VRYSVAAVAVAFDGERLDAVPAFFEACLALSSRALAGVVVAHGLLTEQSVSAKDPAELRRMIDVNFTSAAVVLALAANHFEPRRTGFIAAISSVAGDRGRRSNYVYGSAKAGLTAMLSGMRQRLGRSGVRVLTIKPGFVDTKMTFGLGGMFLVASPDEVADDVVRALRKGRGVVYTPWFWRWIMLVIRAIPEGVFRRLDL
jgi:NAD(P)-dependent dehydrogenase (short-subunit alcohol dehydrogenase family)